MKLLKLLNYELLFNSLSPQLLLTYIHKQRALVFVLFINTPYILLFIMLCFVGHSRHFSHLNDKNNNNNSNSNSNNNDDDDSKNSSK